MPKLPRQKTHPYHQTVNVKPSKAPEDMLAQAYRLSFESLTMTLGRWHSRNSVGTGGFALLKGLALAPLRSKKANVSQQNLDGQLKLVAIYNYGIQRDDDLLNSSQTDDVDA